MLAFLFCLIFVLLTIAFLISKLQNSNTYLIGAMYAVVGLLETACIAYSFYHYNFNTTDAKELTLWLLLGSLGFIVFLNVAGLILQSTMLSSDKKFQKWIRGNSSKNSKCNSNGAFYCITVTLSAIVNYKFKMILFSHLFEFNPTKCQLESTQKFKYFNLFSFLGFIPLLAFLYASFTLMGDSSLKQSNSEVYLSIIDSVVICILSLLLSMVCAYKQKTFFEDQVGEYSMNRVYNVGQQSFCSPGINDFSSSANQSNQNLSHLSDVIEVDQNSLTVTNRFEKDQVVVPKIVKKTNNAITPITVKEQDKLYFENSDQNTGSQNFSQSQKENLSQKDQQKQKQLQNEEIKQQERRQTQQVYQNDNNEKQQKGDEQEGNATLKQMSQNNEQLELSLTQKIPTQHIEVQDVKSQSILSSQQQQEYPEQIFVNKYQRLSVELEHEIPTNKIPVVFEITQNSIQSITEQSQKDRIKYDFVEPVLKPSEKESHKYFQAIITDNQYRQQSVDNRPTKKYPEYNVVFEKEIIKMEPLVQIQQQNQQQILKIQVEQIVSSSRSPPKHIPKQQLKVPRSLNLSINEDKNLKEGPIKAKNVSNHPISSYYTRSPPKVNHLEDNEYEALQAVKSNRKFKNHKKTNRTVKNQLERESQTKKANVLQLEQQYPCNNFQISEMNQSNNFNTLESTNILQINYSAQLPPQPSANLHIQGSCYDDIPTKPVQSLYVEREKMFKKKKKGNKKEINSQISKSNFILSRKAKIVMQQIESDKERGFNQTPQRSFKKLSEDRKLNKLEKKKMKSLEKIYLQRLDLNPDI